MRNRAVFLILAISGAAHAASPALDRKFNQTVKPFIAKYCVACHSGDSAAAQLDLKSYTSVDLVVRDHARWEGLRERLVANEMPPKPIPAPPADLKKEVEDWIAAVRAEEAKRTAGDPGVVLARRLSNAEYNYTIRDLTGRDLQPTREFPVDPANQSGFDNSGESLTMSPALLKKYLDATKEVANHMVLTPDGFDFSPHPMLVETDREKYAIQRIVNFYKSQPTDYADYFEAAWKFKHLGGTLNQRAVEANLSAKYLPMIWKILEDKESVGPVAKLRGMFEALPAPDGGQPPETLRAKCVEMRDFVKRIRSHTAMQFSAPKVKGLSATSQPLMNWKLKEFATSRRKFDPATLRNEGDPPPTVPDMPRFAGLGQEAAIRWAVFTLKERVGDADLGVPKGERPRYEAAFAKFADVFPDVFYVSERGRFFPDDSQDKGRFLSAGFHNVMGYFRDDVPLQELILDDAGKQHLERLWEEFDFIGDHTVRTYTQYYFNQSGEIRGEGRESGTLRPVDKKITDPSVIFDFEKQYLAEADAPGNDAIAMQAIKEHFARVNATIRNLEKVRVEAEPKHLDALVKFAAKAYRRSLTRAEKDDILAYYKQLRDKDSLSHEDAIRMSIVSILMSPDYCYRFDLAPTVTTSTTPKALSGVALANRISYFLWSSMPDKELLAHAAAGDLQRQDVLTAQVKRMMKDERAKGLATEFAGNWLDFRRFQTFNSVDRERFPTFNNDLREAMFQEPIRYIEDLLHRNGSILDLVYGNYTFVNPVLAKHYEMPWPKTAVETNATWIRVDDANKFGRGGILPMSVFLTQNSPGLRTSPVKRGYWVVHRVLGETIPPPPPVVPELPHDEAKMDLPVRDMLAKHRENPTCAGCHAKFDSFGLSFEGYGPVGNARTKDLAGRPVDAKANFPGGTEGVGFEGVQKFIRDHREKEFVDGLSRKLLAFALSRSLQLSDEPLVEKINSRLAANGYKISAMVETIVASPQFLNRRGTELKQTLLQKPVQKSKGDRSE